MRRIIFFLIFLVFAAQILAATTYYVDAANGNDSNDGQSESSAWKTLGRIDSTNFSPGDTILLKRGHIWRETLVINNSSGTSSGPITFGAYGSGDKPQINGAGIETGWSKNSDAIYQKTLANTAKVVIQDNNLLTYLLWNTNVATTFAGASPGSWSCNPNTNTAYVWCTDSTDPDSHTMEVAAVQRDGVHEYGIFISNVSYITIQDIEIINTSHIGVRIWSLSGGTTTNIILKRLTTSNTGHNGIEVNNSGNSSTGTREITGVVIESCTIHDTNNHGICLLYEVVSAKIRNNTIYRTGWGLDASHGITSYSKKTGAVVHDCIIEGNTVSGVRARPFSGEEGTGIQADDLTRDCIYRYNICYNNEGSGFQFNGTSGCKFYYNISYGNGKVYQNNYRGGITLTQPVGIELYNNVCYDNSPVGIGWFGDTSNGVTLKNNIVCQNAEYEIRIGSNADQSVVSDYNCVYHPDGGEFMLWSGYSCDWVDWKNRSGQDAHSLNTNPKFVSLSNKNFNLQSSSPCIDAGDNVGLLTDINGESVPYGQKVDMGACEYVSSTSSLIAIASGSPASGTAPLSVTFTGDETGGTSPYTYNWNFGDGSTSTTKNPGHTYTQSGTYTATFTVTDNSGQQDSDTVQITVSANSLNATISASPTSGQAPLTVTFTRNVSGGVSPFTYNWDFGDGSTSTTNNPVYTYNQAGDFTVRLTVTDSSGQQDSDTETITVSSSDSFSVGMSIDPVSGPAPLTVVFTRIVSGGISPFTYNWDFGDGNTSSVNNPTHTFMQIGDFTVTLTVTDSGGEQKSDTGNISVFSQTSSQFNLSISSSTGAPASGTGGSITPSPGDHTYPSDQNVQVMASPNANYRFSKWTGDVSSTVEGNEDITVSMNADKSITGQFCTRCGDVNGDLTITPTDAQMIFELFLGKISDPTYCQKENADVNCDGTKENPSITPADAQALFDFYLGKSGLPSDCSCTSRSASLGTFLSIKDSLSEFNLIMPEIQPNPGDFITIPVSIDRSIKLNSFGIDLSYNATLLQFIGVGRTDITKNFIQVDGHLIDSGVIRIGGYRERSLQNILTGDLVILIFKVRNMILDPKPVKIIKTFDDLKQASID